MPAQCTPPVESIVIHKDLSAHASLPAVLTYGLSSEYAGETKTAQSKKAPESDRSTYNRYIAMVQMPDCRPQWLPVG